MEHQDAGNYSRHEPFRAKLTAAALEPVDGIASDARNMPRVVAHAGPFRLDRLAAIETGYHSQETESEPYDRG